MKLEWDVNFLDFKSFPMFLRGHCVFQIFMNKLQIQSQTVYSLTRPWGNCWQLHRSERPQPTCLGWCSRVVGEARLFIQSRIRCVLLAHILFHEVPFQSFNLTCLIWVKILNFSGEIVLVMTTLNWEERRPATVGLCQLGDPGLG